MENEWPIPRFLSGSQLQALNNQTLRPYPGILVPGIKRQEDVLLLSPLLPYCTAVTTSLNYIVCSHELGHWSLLDTPEKQ